MLLQAEPDALDIVDGTWSIDSDGRQHLPLAEIGRIGHFQVGELPNSVQPMLSHTRRFRLLDDLYIFTNGIHGAHVEVDTDTGFIRLLKHWVVEDCGRVINPQLADEQVRGGCVQGIGGALYEHCIYDEAGQLANGIAWPTTSRRWRPRCPTSTSCTCRRYTSVSELGAKGVGESGTGAAPAVVMNAVNDALRPFGARVTAQPMTPRSCSSRSARSRTRAPYWLVRFRLGPPNATETGRRRATLTMLVKRFNSANCGHREAAGIVRHRGG